MQEFWDTPLDQAIAATGAKVKAKATDTEARLFLAELLCFSGNLERADLQLDAAVRIDPSLALWGGGFRQILRAEMSRREVFERGRVPEFVGRPGAVLTRHLEALVAWRDGRTADAAALLAEAEASRVHAGGLSDGQAFDDFRDLDDLTASFLEVLTSGGDYYWIGFDQIQKMDFLPPQRPRDLLWRRVRLSVRQGPEGDVFVPVLYWNSHKAEVNDLRIGRQTCWDDSAFPLVRGQGQRCFLIGEVDQPVMSLTTVSFADVTG